MALDNSQKAKIRRYLGYPDVSQLRYDMLEDAMSGVSAEGEVEVELILASLAALDTARTNAIAYAGIKRAEDVEWYEGGQLSSLQPERNRLIAELARILGVEPIPLTGAGFGGACLRG